MYLIYVKYAQNEMRKRFFLHPLSIMQKDLVETMSNTLIERFKVLIANNRDEDALSIMQEYILPNSEIEDDNYQWLIINDLTELT